MKAFGRRRRIFGKTILLAQFSKMWHHKKISCEVRILITQSFFLELPIFFCLIIEEKRIYAISIQTNKNYTL